MKRFAIVLLSVLSLLSTQLFSQPRGIKPSSITASSQGNELTARMACDGDLNTRWGSDFSDNQWIKYEFSRPQELAAMAIRWETAAAYSYDIMVSFDGKNWETAAKLTDESEANYRKINFNKIYTIKYVMIKCIERLTQWGFSIIETEFSDKPYTDLSTKPLYIAGTSFFKVAKKDGLYWLLDPDGKPFIAKGVNCVVPQDHAVKPGAEGYSVAKNFKSREEWGASVVKRLKGFNFNTIGSWSDSKSFAYDMPFTQIVSAPGTGNHRLADLFSPEFAAKADLAAKQYCRSLRNAEYLIGYFVDNELPWYGDVGWYTGHVTTLLDLYLKLPQNSPGNNALLGFFKERYSSISEFNAVWGLKLADFNEIGKLRTLKKHKGRADEDREDFAGLVADRYYAVMTASIKKYDPNHMILGSRFANNAPKRVIAACGKYCDVISLNYYAKDMVLGRSIFDNMYYLGKKPLMVTEFSYRATENNSGNKNTVGANVTVNTQSDRAEGFRKYVTQLMDLPYAVGYLWFQYFDQSPQGRPFDGEDSNYGIIDIHDKEYTLLLKTMTAMNSKVEALHEKASSPYPSAYVDTSQVFAQANNDVSAVKKPAPFRDITKGGTNRIFTWGDKDSETTLKSGVESDGKYLLNLIYDAGNGWGCGISILPNTGVVNKDGSVDLQGYNAIEFEMSLPVDQNFYIFINESGVDGARNSARGSDGESFSSEIELGTGKVERYLFSLSRFRHRMEIGNQYGNRKLDLQAIEKLDLFLPGGSGSGSVKIYGITLK